MKKDYEARHLWGKRYDKIPKSVFASIAWHLANVNSGKADTPGEAESVFYKEWGALYEVGIIPQLPLEARYIERS